MPVQDENQTFSDYLEKFQTLIESSKLFLIDKTHLSISEAMMNLNGLLEPFYQLEKSYQQKEYPKGIAAIREIKELLCQSFTPDKDGKVPVSSFNVVLNEIQTALSEGFPDIKNNTPNFLSTLFQNIYKNIFSIFSEISNSISSLIPIYSSPSKELMGRFNNLMNQNNTNSSEIFSDCRGFITLAKDCITKFDTSKKNPKELSKIAYVFKLCISKIYENRYFGNNPSELINLNPDETLNDKIIADLETLNSQAHIKNNDNLSTKAQLTLENMFLTGPNIEHTKFLDGCSEFVGLILDASKSSQHQATECSTVDIGDIMLDFEPNEPQKALTTPPSICSYVITPEGVKIDPIKIDHKNKKSIPEGPAHN